MNTLERIGFLVGAIGLALLLAACSSSAATPSTPTLSKAATEAPLPVVNVDPCTLVTEGEAK